MRTIRPGKVIKRSEEEKDSGSPRKLGCRSFNVGLFLCLGRFLGSRRFRLCLLLTGRARLLHGLLAFHGRGFGLLRAAALFGASAAGSAAGAASTASASTFFLRGARGFSRAHPRPQGRLRSSSGGHAFSAPGREPPPQARFRLKHRRRARPQCRRPVRQARRDPSAQFPPKRPLYSSRYLPAEFVQL